MAENDIYNSLARYERYKSQIDSLCSQTKTGQKRISICKNPEKLAHKKKLIRVFDIRDQSKLKDKLREQYDRKLFKLAVYIYKL